jgi:pimeloyl-ACP methyl ester carboxylesterase
MKKEIVAVNGVKLHVVQDGPETGELVILLHGFPEFWYGWRKQIPSLSGAGFSVWTPDQRGYNLSDKPRGLSAYTQDELSADVIGLIDAAGREKAVIVGHDWGAAVAWHTAAMYPDRIAKLVVMNVPHGSVMSQHLRRSRAQLRKSWYMFFFQIPWLPEFFIRLGKWRAGTQALIRSSREGTFLEEDLERYRGAWSQPGAITAMINWYRAAIQRQGISAGRNGLITVPAMLIWGAQDRFLSQEMAQPSIDLCEVGRLEMIPEASHWVHLEEPKKVNELLLDFIGNQSHPT